MNAHVRDNFNYLNDSRIVYAQKTVDTAGIVGSGFVVLQAPSFTPINSSRLIKLTARWRGFFSSAADDLFISWFGRTGTADKYTQTVHRTYAANQAIGPGINTHLLASPPAEAQNFTLGFERLSGTGAGTVQGSSAYPAQLIVEDVGAA